MYMYMYVYMCMHVHTIRSSLVSLPSFPTVKSLEITSFLRCSTDLSGGLLQEPTQNV